PTRPVERPRARALDRLRDRASAPCARAIRVTGSGPRAKAQVRSTRGMGRAAGGCTRKRYDRWVGMAQADVDDQPHAATPEHAPRPPSRVVILAVRPEVDGGRYPA